MKVPKPALTTVGCAEQHEAHQSRKRRFAYRDVGEGREQDAEASYLSTSFYK
jgi:hypothetical protein